jgi:hypothetical protein
MSACAGSLTDASRSNSAQRRRERFCGVRPGNNLALFRAARARYSSISPAWSRWIAPGRIGIMSTQRRDSRWAPTTEAGRRGMRHDSRLAHGKDLANRAKLANADLPAWVFPASASGQMSAMATRSTLRQDTRGDARNRQPVRFFWPGSPPVRQAAALRPFLDRLIGYPPIPSPAVFARVHPTLPHVPAALGCRTERYDGKGNLYLQHAA